MQASKYGEFLDRFVSPAARIKVGDGFDPAVEMGPLANTRRLHAMEEFVADAQQSGACIETGGERVGNRGNFFLPTVLSGIPREAKAMNEEPFGPVVLVVPFGSFEEAIDEANRLEYGLASYVFTSSVGPAGVAAAAIESGMVCINHYRLGFLEIPFGGIKASGYGKEGATEGLEAYLNVKFVSHSISSESHNS